MQEPKILSFYNTLTWAAIFLLFIALVLVEKKRKTETAFLKEKLETVEAVSQKNYQDIVHTKILWDLGDCPEWKKRKKSK